MALEPSIDTVYVEDVEAIGQNPDSLLILELVETNSALVARAVLLSSPEPESRDCPDGRLVQAAVGDARQVEGWERAGVGVAPPPSGAGEVAEHVGATPAEAALDHEHVVA